MGVGRGELSFIKNKLGGSSAKRSLTLWVIKMVSCGPLREFFLSFRKHTIMGKGSHC